MTEFQAWIQISVSLTLAVLAIWGETLRARLLGPKLSIRLLDSQGERTSVRDVTNERTPARWYHLQVTNRRRTAHAKNVRVVLTKVSRPSADGVVRRTSLSGPIQLTWQHNHSIPQFPTVGPTLNADLGYIRSDGTFRLTPLFAPNNLNIAVAAGERIVVEALAISDETESKPVSVEIAWDGVWSEDAAEMQRHLVVKEVS